MAVRFSDDQVIQATGGRRVRLGARASYSDVSTDTRALTHGALFVALQGERFDAHDFLPDAVKRGAGGAVVRQGKPLPDVPQDFALFEVDDTLVALGALARYHRLRFTVPVGAVTGSNGKTTTKEMVAAILATRGPALKTQGNLNNEVGVPLTLFGLAPQHVAAVVEMGMNHPGEISRLTHIAQPDAGLITAVQAAHLEGLGSLEGIAQAKGELFFGLKEGATAVVNLDDARVAAQAKASGAKALTYGRAANADVRLEQAHARGAEGWALTVAYEGKRYEVPLRFLGAHNALNATGAFALALALGYRADECVAGLSGAHPHAHRLELTKAAQGYWVLDDCYNANPASMAAALETVAGLAKAQGGKAVAVVGDMLELGPSEADEHRALVERAKAKAALSAFFGPRTSKAAGAVPHAFPAQEDVDALIGWLKPQLAPNDVVLVKASRGMRLERVVDALLGRASSGGAH